MRVRFGLFASNPPKKLSPQKSAYLGYFGLFEVGPTGKALFCRTGSAPVMWPVPLHPHARHEPAATPPPPGNQCHRHKLASSQPSLSGRGLADLNLNSQVPAAEGFPGLGLYGAILQDDDDELLPGHVSPPYCPPRAGAMSRRRPHNSRPHQIRLGKS